MGGSFFFGLLVVLLFFVLLFVCKPPMENENASSPKYGALLKQTLSVERARQSPHFKEKAGG